MLELNLMYILAITTPIAIRFILLTIWKSRKDKLFETLYILIIRVFLLIVLSVISVGSTGYIAYYHITEGNALIGKTIIVIYVIGAVILSPIFTLLYKRRLWWTTLDRASKK